MSDRPPPPNIFDYADYRLYLADYQRARKAVEPRFSHRYITSKVGGSSAGWFADLIKGRSNLSGTHLAALLRLIAFAPQEAAYFEALVRYEQAGSFEEKNLHYRRLVGLKGVKPEMVGADRFEFYSEWHHAVVRELLFFHRFRGDYAVLGKKLHPSISAAEARKSVQLLERLGFVRKGPVGEYAAVETTLKKDPAFKALHLANFLKASIEFGLRSLESFPKEERDISSITLALSPEGFRKAKEEVRALRERLLALTETDANPDRVYQCNFHVFPATR